MTRKPIPPDIEAKVREFSKNRCCYCLVPHDFLDDTLQKDHIIAVTRSGSDDESNLCLACPRCNRSKRDKIEAIDPQTGQIVPLFNPRTQNWFEHFEWSWDLKVIGLTPVGRATVALLGLDTDKFSKVRRNWGWHPPQS